MLKKLRKLVWLRETAHFFFATLKGGRGRDLQRVKCLKEFMYWVVTCTSNHGLEGCKRFVIWRLFSFLLCYLHRSIQGWHDRYHNLDEVSTSNERVNSPYSINALWIRRDKNEKNHLLGDIVLMNHQILVMNVLFLLTVSLHFIADR